MSTAQRFVLTILLILALLMLLDPGLRASAELSLSPPTSLRVSRVFAYDPTRLTYDLPISPAARDLYLIMRTSAPLPLVGGCRISSNPVSYDITFFRGDAVLLDAIVRPDCYSFFLSRRDHWYQLHLTNAEEPYSAGRYHIASSFARSFTDATGLPYPP